MNGGRRELLCCRRPRPDEHPAPSARVVACTNQACSAPDDLLLVGFNLILWTKQLILKEYGIDFSGFVTATLAALLIGKAVLVTDNLPFMRRFDGAPLI